MHVAIYFNTRNLTYLYSSKYNHNVQTLLKLYVFMVVWNCYTIDRSCPSIDSHEFIYKWSLGAGWKTRSEQKQELTREREKERRGGEMLYMVSPPESIALPVWLCVCAWGFQKCLLAEWLGQTSQEHKINCHDLEVVGLNSGWVELGVCSILHPTCIALLSKSYFNQRYVEETHIENLPSCNLTTNYQGTHSLLPGIVGIHDRI